jgi:formate hydrogenlyase subunit 3/multisubunit Na+/H+ antiporter MnhD subunit
MPRKRPHSITIIGWLFLVVGVVGLAYHATEFNAQHPFDYELVWVCFVRLLAILCGVFILRGSNRARWLLVVWLGYHVALSVLHTPFELAVHGLLFAVILFFLFRAPASAYFRGARTPAQSPKSDDIRAA